MNVESLSCEHILARALEAAGGPAWARVATLHLKGRVAVGGLSGPTAQWVDLPTARHAMHLQLGPAALAAGFDGHVAWQRSANGEVLVQDADAALRAAATDAWIHARGWWFSARHPASCEALGRREADGRTCDVVRCVPAGGEAVERRGARPGKPLPPERGDPHRLGDRRPRPRAPGAWRTAGGPADEAGLRVDDVLETVDGAPVPDIGLAALRARLAEASAGERVAIGVRRGSAVVQATLLLRDLV